MTPVSDERDLQRAVAALAGSQRFFIDTEFESSRQGKTLSLIQVSRGEEIFIIDALQLPSLQTLGDMLCEASTEWVLHAGLQDVELLCAAFGGREPPKLFDTQVAWALLGPEAGVSLAFLQFKLLGIRTSKGYQADDWMRRPLPAAQLQYAAEDIAHLPALAQKLHGLAQPMNRDRFIRAASFDMLRPTAPPAQPLGFESFRNAWQLDARGQGALRNLIDWHNGPAGSQAGLQARTLLAIASRQPRSPRDLARIKGVSSAVVRRHGAELVQLVARGEAVDAPTLEPPAYASFEHNVREAKLMLLRAELCAELSVAPEIALPMAIVRRMIHRVNAEGSLRAARPELSGWREELLAPAFDSWATRLET